MKFIRRLPGDAPSPLTPDEFDEVLKKLPRDLQDVDLFKNKSQARARCRPTRFGRRCPLSIFHYPL